MNIREYVENKLNKNELNHKEKYGTIVSEIGLERCVQYLPITDKDVLKAKIEEDEHLNNIPLQQWDSMHPYLRKEFINIGITSISLSDTVCTLKECARLYANS